MDANDFNIMADFMKMTDRSSGFLSNAKRGTAFYYSEAAVDTFLEANGLTHIIRGHEVVQEGYKFHMNGKVITIFSCANYCGGNNQAATLYVDGEKIQVVRITVFGTNYF